MVRDMARGGGGHAERDAHQQGAADVAEGDPGIAFRLGAGDRVDFVVEDDGTIVLKPATSPREGAQGLPPPEGASSRCPSRR